MDDSEKARRDPMVRAYLEAALFTSTDDAEQPLDGYLTVEDFTDEAVLEAAAHCRQFERDADAAVATLERAGDAGVYDYNREDLGHDFWMTRNGHGVGFWDRPAKYGQLADVFSALSDRFGETWVYVSEIDADGELILRVEFG